MENKTKEKIFTKIRAIASPSVPFWQQLEEHRLKAVEMQKSGKPEQNMNLPIWNLIHTYRDLHMYVGHGIKPTRAWKVSHPKQYFGIKGTGQKLLDNFLEIYHAVAPVYLNESYKKEFPEQWEELCS
tara:strand:- start:743 stop:1123 length:381 start_codon:yes stop_codon:yes gene_type:complete